MWRWDQAEPFGANPADENPSGLGAFDLPLRLPGQRYDAETGLHYNYFRDYDAGLARYVESDPIGLRGGVNTYAYVRAIPLGAADPLGLLEYDQSCAATQGAMQEAEQEIVKKLEASCGACSNENTGCVPCEYVQPLRNAILTSKVKCSSTPHPADAPGNESCATGFVRGGEITFYPIGLSSKCGCIKATLFHELLHNIGLKGSDHPEINYLERRCFTCAPQRKGIGPWTPPVGNWPPY